MNNLQMWTLIVGFLTPLVTAVVQQPKWGAHVRAGAGFAISTVLALATCYFDGSLDDASSTVGAVLLVAVASISTYKHLWTPLKIAPAIEAATSPGAVVEQVVPDEPAAVPAPTVKTAKKSTR